MKYKIKWTQRVTWQISESTYTDIGKAEQQVLSWKDIYPNNVYKIVPLDQIDDSDLYIKFYFGEWK